MNTVSSAHFSSLVLSSGHLCSGDIQIYTKPVLLDISNLIWPWLQPGFLPPTLLISFSAITTLPVVEARNLGTILDSFLSPSPTSSPSDGISFHLSLQNIFGYFCLCVCFVFVFKLLIFVCFCSLYLVAVFSLISCHSSTLTLCSSPMKLPTPPEYSVPFHIGASLVVQMIKNLPAMQETWVWSPSWEDPLEKGIATHSSILAWRIPLTEEPCGLQSIGLQRVGHGWVT